MSAPDDPTHPKVFEADESLSRPDQDDVEGHGKYKGVEQDRPGEAVESEEDDVEGHGKYRG